MKRNTFKKKLRLVNIAWLFIFFLTACGGGGSGAGGNASPGNGGSKLTLTPDQPALFFQYEENSPPYSSTLVVSISGKPANDFYIAAAIEGIGIDPNISIETGTDKAVFRIFSQVWLSAGTYSGKILVVACADAACTKTIGNTKVDIPYTIKVLPILKVSSSDIKNSVSFGTVSTQKINVQLPAGENKFTVTSNTSWLVATDVTTNSFILNFDIVPPNGDYRAEVQVSSGSKLITIPVSYVVKDAEQITSDKALSLLVGASNWDTYQGSNSHNGYVPVNLDPSKFSFRWRWPANTTNSGATSVVISDGRIYAGFNRTLFTPYLMSLNESDSSMNWLQVLDGEPSTVASPIISEGKLFAATSRNTNVSFWSFDALTGVLGSSKSYSSIVFATQNQFFAVANNAIYFNDAGARSLGKINIYTGDKIWSSDDLNANFFSPSIDNNYAYINAVGSLKRIQLNDGSIKEGENIGLSSDYRVNYPLPVLVGDGRMVMMSGFSERVASNNTPGDVRLGDARTLALLNSDLNAVWRVDGNYINNPVVANEVVYIFNEKPLQLEARNLDDGKLLWAWAPDGNIESRLIGNIIVTDNLVFFSTNKLTRAIGINTHKSLWAYPKPSASLAISANGVLHMVATDYVPPADEILNTYFVAINLH